MTSTKRKPSQPTDTSNKKRRTARNWKKEWAKSNARQTLDEHLMSGTLPLDGRGDGGMSARQAWEIYKKRSEFADMDFKFFQSKLSSLRSKWRKKKGIGVILEWDFSDAKKMLEEDFGTDKLPREEDEMSAKDAWTYYENQEARKGANYGLFSSKLKALRTKWQRRDAVDWRASSARLIILYDLERGTLSTDNDEEPAEELWEQVYSGLEEFEDVPFWQFEEKLKDHRRRHEESLDLSLQEDMILADDLEKHPTTTHNARGELKFYLTKAKQLLRQDVEKNNHKGLLPSEFQATRVEYHPFDKRKFRERIRQEVRFQKFCNYLEDKRKDKLAKAREEELKKKNNELKKKNNS